MCGIAGIYSREQNFSEEKLKLMTSALLHRGPDAGGFFIDGDIALGHRRLSILDLSDNANQPMMSQNGRYVMVYNGEVYNYRDIGAELKQNFAVNFKTSSDTEIILEAFAHYGVEFVKKLNGMFAIAIYDLKLKELYLFRDRVGIKPLYYYMVDDDVYFASEIKAIKSVITSKLDIEYKAVQLFLNLGFIPAPLSIYKNLYKLESGNYLKITSQKVEKNQYWSSFDAVSQQLITNEKEALVKITDLLSSSIQYQLKSDVPFGVFLSGGIDSSLITAQASSISSVPINTFSIGFKENKFNESFFARKVANHFKTNHFEFIVSEQDVQEQIGELIDVYDEPFADSSAFPTMMVSKLAKSNVTVCLSGEGGDELFLGYGAYLWANRLNKPLVQFLRKPASAILSNSNTRYKRHANYFNYPNKKLLSSHILSQEQDYFSLLEINNLISNEFRKEAETGVDLLYDFENKTKTLDRKLSPMEKQAFFDLNYYLQEDLLTKVDRASMRYSLETRVPYLDHRLIELALNISPTLKYKNGESKYLLKEILYQYIPKSYFDRPKQGFAIPLSIWLKNEWRFLIDKYLDPKVIAKYNVVRVDESINLVNRYLKGEDSLYNRIWLLIVLHKFLEKQ